MCTFCGLHFIYEEKYSLPTEFISTYIAEKSMIKLIMYSQKTIFMQENEI